MPSDSPEKGKASCDLFLVCSVCSSFSDLNDARGAGTSLSLSEESSSFAIAFAGGLVDLTSESELSEHEEMGASTALGAAAGTALRGWISSSSVSLISLSGETLVGLLGAAGAFAIGFSSLELSSLSFGTNFATSSALFFDIGFSTLVTEGLASDSLSDEDSLTCGFFAAGFSWAFLAAGFS